MASYCQSTDITPYLPTGHGISSFTAIITGASALVDAKLSPRYWTPFPDYNGTPATPAIVARAAVFFGAWLSWQQIAPSNRFGESQADKWWEMASKICDELLNDDPNTAQIPLETISSETMTNLGAGPLEATEYKLAVSPKTVIPESVAISTYMYGEDFTVGYDIRHRGWILTIIDTGITAASTVSYQYSYLKKMELDLPPKYTGGRIVRA